MDIRDTPTRRASRGVGVVAKDKVAAWRILTFRSLAGGGLAVALVARTRRTVTRSCNAVALSKGQARSGFTIQRSERVQLLIGPDK